MASNPNSYNYLDGPKNSTMIFPPICRTKFNSRRKKGYKNLIETKLKTSKYGEVGLDFRKPHRKALLNHGLFEKSEKQSIFNRFKRTPNQSSNEISEIEIKNIRLRGGPVISKREMHSAFFAQDSPKNAKQKSNFGKCISLIQGITMKIQS